MRYYDLAFNAAQEAAVINSRRHFNASQVALAAAVATGGSLIGNALTVPLDAWRRIDGRFQAIQRSVLAVYSRLSAANTVSLDVGDIMSYYPKITDSGEVNWSLDGRSNSLQDQAMVEFAGTPVPVIDSFSRIGWRQMAVMMRGSPDLAAQSVANNQRKVAEALESMVINGKASIVIGGSPIYGLLNFPDRSTDVHGFDLIGATGANWLTAVGKGLAKLRADNAYGKATLFVNYADWEYADQTDYAAAYSKTIAQRMMEMMGIQEVVPASGIPTNALVFVNNLSGGEWGSVLTAMPPVTRTKTRVNTEDDYVMGAMAVTSVQFRGDSSGQSQIAVVTKA
jgi:uncharacterized linocin/CFP29 family protein